MSRQNPMEIVPLTSDNQKNNCASLMSMTEPWVKLGRSFEDSLAIFSDPSRECFGAFDGDQFIGFLVIDLNGPFKGYIQSICIIPSRRGASLGKRLVEFAEEKIFQVSPNAFICVSDFNPRAKKLYQRLGYKVVGKLKNYIISGNSEILMRKTIAPLQDFSK